MSWIYKGKEFTELCIPENSVGFIYIMTAIIDGKSVAYIGKKNFYSNTKKHFTKKQLLLSTDKRVKKYSRVIKPNFINYYSSNEVLKSAHKSGIIIKKEILMICYSTSELTYQECKFLFCNDCITDDKYLNSNILGRFFRNNLKI